MTDRAALVLRAGVPAQVAARVLGDNALAAYGLVETPAR
jgi:hypothetical protein